MHRLAIPGSFCLAVMLLAAPGVRAAAPATACAYNVLFGVDATPGGFCPIRVDSHVSTKILSQRQVYKIQGADMTIVVVSKTSSGTYSTDAISSPAFHYVGIQVVEPPAQG
jgi:hypothetical protein